MPSLPCEDELGNGKEGNDWDPLTPEAIRDPHANYAKLRERCPLAHSERWGGFWALLKYADVVAVAENAGTFITSIQNVIPAVNAGKRIPLHFDPPSHGRYRRILNLPFDADRLAELEPRIRQLMVSFLEPLISKGRGDLVKEFTNQAPIYALCEFLKVPSEEAPEIKLQTERYAGAHAAEDRESLLTASDALYASARRVVAARRAEPLDPERDVTSGLLAARLDGKPLDEELIVGCLRLLLVAGHLTMTYAIASAVRHLAADPELQEQLRRHPCRIADAVEEFLRLYPPNQAFARTVTHETEIRGKKIQPGEPIALVWISANRDPDVFPDPNEFHLDRPSNRHLAFGHGIHKCLGAPLARLEIRLALEELLARTRRFELDGPVSLETGWPEYGPTSVPIRFLV